VLGRAGRPLWQQVVRGALALGVVMALVPVLFVAPLRWIDPPTTMFIVARAAERLAEGERPVWPRRTVVARSAMAPSLRRAVLAAEDDRFFLHDGFDFVEIDRALERAERGGRLRGASTISQQLAKNLLLWEGRSWIRKGYEVWITLVVEVLLPKERILDIYLNAAEWGDGIFGGEAAARTYFNTSAARLTREQSARLAAVLPAPRRWSPNGPVARRRAARIAQRMGYAAPRDSD
jgi:monofunctional biosynthetic peptidoglycan transglycosylase